ncbi:MAG: hypothetical protein CMK96_06230 [Pseudomonas sp.]|nr:hypothetical protein [Pseudomonas sp.]QDP67221.1 MAG: hypothetical protein GOVbin7368_12 [Prokaryotic dsDNA virus sp.]|tara:strand:- start:33312 stop:33785 length:474 start_codon:yes stop_codon:yes gene_type:complete
MTTPDTSTEALYEGPCEAGCSHYHGGEVRHTPGCGHYPNSLTKAFEDQISALAAERDAEKAKIANLHIVSDTFLKTANEQFHRAERLERDLTASAARADALEAEVQKLREALEWYEEKARLCRLIHNEGEAARQALHRDGGDIARAALTPQPEEKKA